jgi:flagellar basal-body rod protein FlgB
MEGGRPTDGRRRTGTDAPTPRPRLSMELFDTTQVALERAMTGAAMRHQAIAANLANVNTPGYRRRDVDFHASLQQAMSRDGDPHRAQFAVTEERGGATRADGSSIDADAEGAALARNALEQQALAAVVKARVSIIQSAIGQ